VKLSRIGFCDHQVFVPIALSSALWNERFPNWEENHEWGTREL